MSKQTIRLLHVEDDQIQRLLLEHHLAVMDDFEFDIHVADSESAALDLFDGGGTEFVILDYQLRHGNGLNCLKELRRRDPIVPVVAISGVATAEIASDLLQAGADDYLNKAELTSSRLARVVREAVIRANGCRPRIQGALHPAAASQSPLDAANGFCDR